MAHAELTTRDKFDTIAARDERARGRASQFASAPPHAPRDAHRHIRAACPDSTRANSSSMSKSHAAARNQSTFVLSRHRRIPLTYTQARARTIASVSGRRAKFHFDRGLAGKQPIRSEADAPLPCANATHAREERGGAAQRPEALTNVPRRPQSESGEDWPHPRCVTLHPRPPPASTVSLACTPPLPVPTRSDPLGA